MFGITLGQLFDESVYKVVLKAAKVLTFASAGVCAYAIGGLCYYHGKIDAAAEVNEMWQHMMEASQETAEEG